MYSAHASTHDSELAIYHLDLQLHIYSINIPMCNLWCMYDLSMDIDHHSKLFSHTIAKNQSINRGKQAHPSYLHVEWVLLQGDEEVEVLSVPHMFWSALIRIQIPPSPAILAGKQLSNGPTQHCSALISTDQSAQHWMNWSVLSPWKLNRTEKNWVTLNSAEWCQLLLLL